MNYRFHVLHCIIFCFGLAQSTELRAKRLLITIVNGNQQQTVLHNGSQPDAGAEPTQPSSRLQAPPISIVYTIPDTVVEAENTSSPAINLEQPITIQNHNNQETTIINTTPPPVPSISTEQKLPTPLIAEATSPGILSSLLTHKASIGLGIVALTYSSVLGFLLYQGYKVRNNNGWASWGPWQTLDELKQEDQKTVAEQLYDAILQKYPSQKKQYGFLTTSILFLEDIEREYAKLERFCTTHAWLKTFWLHLLFPGQRTTLERAQEQIQKLLYLKELLLSWMHNDDHPTTYADADNNQRNTQPA